VLTDVQHTEKGEEEESGLGHLIGRKKEGKEKRESHSVLGVEEAELSWTPTTDRAKGKKC